MKGGKKGFTLLELMAVLAILGILAAVIMPKLAVTSREAQAKIDVITGQELKGALDRYEAQNGVYPLVSEMTEIEGSLESAILVPDYIKSLHKDIVQQKGTEAEQGFGLALWQETGAQEARRTVTVYLTNNGSKGEVQVFSGDLERILWSSF